ncbi:DUF3152 domain-containing protein [Streptomyces sp. NPDC058947]|uniref:DUF3152 domain-containing protein n=1 Tax=Streptomyces sp. NPDC058947 TaxID=3346675 RepID=UPI0036746766
MLLLASAALAFQVSTGHPSHNSTGAARQGALEATDTPGTGPTGTGRAPAPGPTGPTGTPGPRVPRSGNGDFVTAAAVVGPTGTGPDVGYAVMVEDGSGLDAEAAAREIAAILADPRGWAAHGRGRFRQTDPSSADLVIKIATPVTADRLCAAYGLDTGGELNCETPGGVVVNLLRWQTGSPQFDGTPQEYRPLIVNHEVGHYIGLSQHLDCPGPGLPAPVMMQQIKGLHGCRSNAWPYDEYGAYLDGPPAA